MEVVQTLEQPVTDQPVVLTIGKFDGVHLGHQRLITAAVEQARQRGYASAVLTFHPHPRTVINPEHNFYLLTSLEERIVQIGAFQPDYLLIAPFNRATMSTPAYDYMQQICAALPLRALLVGAGFALGRKREGTVERLREIGHDLGYSVEAVPPVEIDGQVVSASRVRGLLLAGDVTAAARLLGRDYWLRGGVSHGDERGRTIGFPTANLVPAEDHLVPANGVYACRVQIETGPHAGPRWLPAVTNVGVRPTFAGTRRTIEAHLLDWQGDLYDQTIRLSFVRWLRGEQKFAGIDALVAQIGRDAAAARGVVGNLELS